LWYGSDTGEREGKKRMNVTCISASNIEHSGKTGSTSYRICESIVGSILNRGIPCERSIIDLREYSVLPCIGCGRCYDTHRCAGDSAFNRIYETVMRSDAVFIVSPHYAPIPAKLCMVLEKMEQITFLHWGKDTTYRSELYGIPAGIISHGGGADWALPEYRRMVNDTIANALATIQLKTVPFSEEWKTGISLPVRHVEYVDGSPFPVQEYGWDDLVQKISAYVEAVMKSLPAARPNAGSRTG
jgi:hypothetical protein